MSDRLSLLDASLLQLESARVPLHTGGLGVFAPGLTFADVHETLAGRLDEIPLARQRLQEVPYAAGRPVWVDDQHFDLSYHLRHAALPSPGGPAALAEVLARIFSRQLDRSRPLWELYVIEGLEGGRTALFRKVSLVMVGGDEGDPFSVLLDEKPQPRQRAGGTRWEPRRPPSGLRLALKAGRERVAQVADVGRAVQGLVQAPERVAGKALGALESAAGVVARVTRQAPESPLNRRLSAHRRLAATHVDLDALRRIRRVFGGTINDIVVAVTGDAVGRLLRWRGYETKDLDLRVMVPVRVHSGGTASGVGVGESQTIGGAVVGVMAPLPVMQMDPVARLYRIMGEMAGLKESRQAVAADTLVRLAGYAPPNLHALAARLASGEARYNLALSNAPGPQEPRYLHGVRLERSYPFIPLAGDCALSIALTSYDGRMYVGLVGDWDGMPDLDTLGEFIGEAVADLLTAAEEQDAAS
jgi:diacylglycerol O-acyltransferase